jgi:glutamine amidotransferase-like uncharacterized protein
MSEDTKLPGPKRAKRAIDEFESWLKERCKKPVEVETIEAQYQYITGHSPRTLDKYLLAIQSSGKIQLSFNGGSKYCQWIAETDVRLEAKPPPEREKPASHIVKTRVIDGAEVTTGTFFDIKELRKKFRSRMMPNE